MDGLRSPANRVGDEHGLVTVLQSLNHRERQANLGVEPAKDQPFAPAVLHGVAEGAILECVHRGAIDRLETGKLRQDRRKRRTVDAVFTEDTHFVVYIAHHVSGDAGKRRLWVVSIRYLDTCVKVDGAWLFAERVLYVDRMEERALS
jgi:hypothetical protein